METALCPVTVGREREMERLGAALAAARGGNGRAIVLAGDGGLGKTRLAADLRRLAAGEGLVTLWGGCSEAELSLPYLPFLEAIGNHLAQADLDALRRRLTASPRELARLFPQLQLEEPPHDPSDPVQGKLRLFEAVLGLLRACAQPRGLLLVLEDLQGADAATRELLEYIVRRLPGTPVLLLVTCRLEELDRRHPLVVTVDHWRRAGLAERLHLGPLSDERVGEMISATVGVETVGAEVRRLLHQRSEGNPFALEEILKEALDRGAVSRLEATWHQESLRRLRLPRTVRDSVLGRLGHLPEEAAEILRCASVLGRSFDYPLLVAISGRGPREVQAALLACVRHQLLEEDPETDGRYRFRHSLTREAVYEDLLVPQRQDLHAAAAAALRQRSSPAVELCQHLLAAGLEREAVPLGLDAAGQATRTHAYREAANLYQRLLPLVEEEGRPELRCRLGQVLLLDGDAAGAERQLAEGVAALDRLGDRRAAAHHRLSLGRCHWERSRPDLAAAEYEAARAVLEPEGPSEDLALAYVRLANLAAVQLDGARAVEMAGRAVAIAGAAGADAPRIWAYNFLGLGRVQLGDWEAGLAEVDRSYREAAAAGLDVIAANALYNGILVRVQHLRPVEALERVGALRALRAGSMSRLQALRAEGTVYLWGLGQPGKALTAYRDAMELARQGEALQYVNWLVVQLAVAHLQLDRLDEARRLLPGRSRERERERQDRVIERWAEMRLHLDSGRPAEALAAAQEVLAEDGWPLRVRLFLGDVAVETLVAAGRLADAAELVHRVTSAGGDPGHPWLLRMRGRVAGAEGGLEEAVLLLGRAADAFRTVGCRHEEARSQLALAGVLAEAGRVEAAQVELRAALDGAEARGAALEARLARDALSRLGSQAITAEHVKEALESLHHPGELGAAALGRLLGLESDPGGGRLRALLVEHVESLATSPDGREREAGHLLRDYYVRRVGSQELVADRLHLTRATFYRRLHLGWSLLVDRITT